jgi:microcystin-dependent protein
MSTYSPILRTELIGAGEQPGTWGSTTNSNFQYIFESAIAGSQAVTVSPTANNQVLTYVNGPSVTPALNQSIYATLKLNAGTLGAAFNIFAPPVSKTYIIWNNTSYTATFYNSSVLGNTTAAGSGIVIPAGAKVIIWSDGANFWGIDSTTGNLTVAGTLTVTGTTALTGVATLTAQPILSSLTASQAVFTDASKGLVSVANTGTGSNVLAVSPTFTGVPAAPTAAPGTSTTQIATTAFVTQNAVLTGTINMWPTATAPTGYLLCAGAAVSRTTYAALFAVISTTFGIGDGSTTFNLPNYTGRMPYGATVGATGGSADAVVVSHTHSASSSVSDPGHKHGPEQGSFVQQGGSGQSGGFTGDGKTLASLTASATTGISVATTIASAGVSGTNANLPPYLGINFIIKT